MDIPESLRGELCGDWKSKLLLTPTHLPKALLANAMTALREAPEWQGVLAHDEFARTNMVMAPPPWRRASNDWAPAPWTDRDDALATEWLHYQKIGVSVGDVTRAADAIAKETSFHPVRDYLDGLEWDGTERLDGFAAGYLGTERTEYYASAGRCIFIAAVARIRQPGCKVDHVPILEGPQGALKSTTLRALFHPWFSDDLAELGSKDAQMQSSGVWCLEIAELASMRRAEVERVKAFVSRRVERYRPSYGRYVIEVPRQCIFIGTTNADEYLKDETGSRRFWPFKCGRIDLAAVERDRDQLWAEAAALHQKGASWWLNGNASSSALIEQAKRYVDDAWAEDIANYLEDKDVTSVPEILRRVVDKSQEHWTQLDQNRVAACLHALGFVRRQRREGKGRKWRYCRALQAETGDADEDW